MKQFRRSRRAHRAGVSAVLAAAIACLAASPALASQFDVSGLGFGDSSACSAPALTQPFLSAKDSNLYALMSGENPGSFNGAGWTLSGGAAIETGQGGAASVLNLPSGSQAVSPPVCVSSAYPTARMRVRNVVGGEGVQVYVAYAGTKTATQPQNTGQVHGQATAWTLSNPINVQPGNLPGWQLMRFVLVPGGKSSDFQIYDFYVDPKMHY